MHAWLHAWLTITLKLVDFSLRPCMFSGCTWMRLGMRLLIPNSQNLTLLVEDLGMRLDWDWILVWKSSFDLFACPSAWSWRSTEAPAPSPCAGTQPWEWDQDIPWSLHGSLSKDLQLWTTGWVFAILRWCVRNSVAVWSTVKHSTVLGHSLVPRPPVHKAMIMMRVWVWDSGHIITQNLKEMHYIVFRGPLQAARESCWKVGWPPGCWGWASTL